MTVVALVEEVSNLVNLKINSIQMIFLMQVTLHI